LQYAKLAAPRPDRMTPEGSIAADPRSGALSDLRRAVQALRLLVRSPDDLAELSVIDAALLRLSQPARSTGIGIADFDPTRLAGLLQITGPELAPELLARLTEDLTNTQDTLTAAAPSADWKRLREGSHVLISLAGSVGALSLQALSESLNAMAHAQDSDALVDLMPPLDAELAALIRLIRATRPPIGTAR
jgi:HPt (histidine-containing phosphotransfer) domain-containing protein